MDIVLSNYGQSFATRSRARSLIEAMSLDPAEPVRIDFGDVAISPSFMAEALDLLSRSGRELRLVGAQDETLALAANVCERLGFSAIIDRAVLA